MIYIKIIVIIYILALFIMKLLLPPILDHSSEFLVSLSMQNQSLFVSLLWWLPIIPSDVLKNLSLLIHKQALNLVPFSQLITIIVQR